MAKRGLKHRDVAKDHFSSGVVLDEPKFSRLIVRFIEGKNLLAADVETGKSDPVAFVWCGPCNEFPNLEEADLPESGILRTNVCKKTVNPIWNEDVIFPLDITNIKDLMDTKCVVYIRDEDVSAADEGVLSYDELGMLELPFKDIFQKGKVMKNSVVVSGMWYTLMKSPGMRKVDGSVKITLTVIFAPEDSDAITAQLPSAEAGTNFTRASSTQLQSISQRVQKYLVSPPSEAAGSGDAARERDPRLRLSLTSLGRPSSAKVSSRGSFTVTSIAPMVRRPSTAPQKRQEEASALPAPEPAGRAPGRRALRGGDEEGEFGEGEEGSDGVLEEGDEEDEDEEGDEEDEEEDGEGEGDEQGSAAVLSAEGGGGRRGSQRSKPGSKQGSRRASADGEEELSVLSKTQHAARLQQSQAQAQSKQRRSSKDGLEAGDLGVAVGGYDLHRLLDADPEGGEQVMRDLVKLGVERVTAAMGSAALAVDEESEGAARAIAEKLRDVAQGLAAADTHGAPKVKRTAHGEPNEAASEIGAPGAPSPSKEPLPKGRGQETAVGAQTPAAAQDEQPTKSEEDSALLAAGPGGGDEGVVQDLLASGAKAVLQGLQDVDIDIDVVGTAQGVGKVVAKKALGAADAAASTVKRVASQSAQGAASAVNAASAAARSLTPTNMKDGGHSAATSVHSLAVKQGGNLVDELMPGVDPSEHGRKDAAGKGSASLSMGARSPRQRGQEVKSAERNVISSSFSQPSGEEAFLHMMTGDFAENPGEEGDLAGGESSPSSKSPKRKRPKSGSSARADGTAVSRQQQSYPAPASPGLLDPSSGAMVPLETAAALSAATMAHLALQAELKQQAQGHATAVVRALKEMTSQRKVMEHSLEKIAQATAAGFSKLSERISHLEEVLLQGGGASMPSKGQLLLGGPEEGDLALPPSDDPQDEAQAGADHRRSGDHLNHTTPGRVQGRGANTSSAAGTARAGRGKASTTAGSGLNAVKAGAPGRRAGAPSPSPPPRRPLSAAAGRPGHSSSSQSSNKENASAGDRYGNVGAIAQAKALARAAKKKVHHPPYAAFEDAASNSSSAGNASSNNNFHFQPKMQLVLHGEDGRVVSTQLAEPPQPDMQSPTLPMYPPQQPNGAPSGRPYSGAVVSFQAAAPHNSGDYPYGLAAAGTQGYGYSQGGYQPQSQGYPQSPSQYGGSGAPTPVQPVSAMAFQSAAAQSAGQQAVRYPLNREFSEVLERGSLEDVARLLESTAPRPEDLSASVRNRLFDAVATLLHQHSHTERCLIWVLALVRGPRSLLAEVVGHTVRDLKEALESVALEASKRGLLASLLKSQINR